MKKINDSGLRKRFKRQSHITQAELYRYFREKEPGLKATTLRWRIYRLKKSNILLPVKRGVYSLNQKSIFKPAITKKMKRLVWKYNADFSPSLRCIIWTTEWLHQFMVQQPNSHLVIIETEKDSIDSLFYHIQDEFKNTYINPDKDNVRDYVSRQKEAIIIKPLISRSPTILFESGVETASLEKMLIDIFCDDHLFISYQGSELENIFSNSWKNYSLNLSALMNYANRRKRGNALKKFLQRPALIEIHKLITG